MFRTMLMTALGAVLALSLGAAGAYFTTQIQVPDSVIKGGRIALSAEPTSAPLAIEALAPGTSVTRPFTVVNDGTLAEDVVVTAVKKAGITDFYNALTCRVTCADTQLYDGTLAELKTSALRLAPGARGELRFEIGLPATAGNDLSNDYAKVSLYVDAEQAH